MITEDNFEDVFEYWNRTFGNSVRNSFKTSRYFVSDIQKDNTYMDLLEKENKVFFSVGQSGDWKEKRILTKIDRLTDETI